MVGEREREAEMLGLDRLFIVPFFFLRGMLAKIVLSCWYPELWPIPNIPKQVSEETECRNRNAATIT